MLRRASHLSSQPCYCISRRYASDDRAAKREAFFASRDTTSDMRIHNMREHLFGSEKDPAKGRQALDAKRAAALAEVVPSREAHETIERAWSLFRRRIRESRKAALDARISSLRQALVALEQADPNLFEQATLKPTCSETLPAVRKGNKSAKAVSESGRIPGLFPRQLRVPTETPRTSLWNGDWKRPVDDQ